jgi:hypothetical protein
MLFIASDVSGLVARSWYSAWRLEREVDCLAAATKDAANSSGSNRGRLQAKSSAASIALAAWDGEPSMCLYTVTTPGQSLGPFSGKKR